MPAPYAQNALATGEFQLTSDERAQLGLQQPGHPAAMPLPRIGKVAVARLRWAMGELVALNVDNVNAWLQEAAKDSPSRAIELFIELAKFSAPQLKAVAVDVRSGDGSVRSLSTSDLERVVSES